MCKDNIKNCIDGLQKTLGYRFKHPEYLQQSLTHPSYYSQHPEEGDHNQRLEFLGDALLSAILADELFHHLPKAREGTLTRNRAIIANGSYLAEMAARLGIECCIRLSESEKRNLIRSRNSILEDTIEAIVAAIYLDSGWEVTRKIVLGWFGKLEEKNTEIFQEHNPKGQLQELVQPKFGNTAIEYKMTGESGPDHEKSFTVDVMINGNKAGKGLGYSKKEAEENAARNALDVWSRKTETGL